MYNLWNQKFQTPFKVKDISLAEWGRKRDFISRERNARSHVTEKEFGKENLLKVLVSLVACMTIQTAVLIETLVDLGAEVTWVLVIFFSNHAAAAIAAAGIPHTHGKE